MRAKLSFLVLTALVIGFAGQAFAQTGGGIVGNITDEQGAVLPGVSVTAENMATGLQRVVTTSSLGRFVVRSLPAGTYKVTAQMGGFADTVLENVRVHVGRTTPVKLDLKAAGVAETLIVTADRPMIQTTESEVSTTISEELIKTLPIADRNALTLALLVPGVAAAPYFDPTKSRDNFDGVSFGAGSGSENLVLVDGADNNDDVVGSILQFYPQDSIQEFEVISTRFKAEYGHTDGGVINMVTKTGSNQPFGGGYWLFRHDALNSKSFVEADNNIDKAEFQQNTLGGYFGGPIKKDRVHFFGNIDYTDRNKPLTTSTNGLLPIVDEQGQVPQDFTQPLFVGKVSAQLNADNYMMARYAYQDDETLNVNLTSRDGIAHGGLGGNTYHSFVAKLQTVFGGDTLNEVFYQFNDFENGIVSNASGTPVDRRELLVGNSSLGQNINHPQHTEQTKHQFVDNFSWRQEWKGDHELKAGFEYQRVNVSGFFTEGTPFVSFEWDTEQDWLAGRNANFAATFDGPLFDVGESYNNIFAFYLQDDWQPADRLTLNLGLRYDVETNDWTQANRTFISRNPLFFGAQPDTDKNNFGPRVGFAYDTRGDGRTVVRGGYGLYYQQAFWNSPIRNAFAEGLQLGELDFTDPTFTPDMDFCSEPTDTGEEPPPGCIPVPTVPAPTAGDFLGASFTGTVPDTKTPYTHQFSFGVSTLLPHDWALDADFVLSRSSNQIYRTRRASNDIVGGFDVTNMGTRASINLPGAESSYTALLLSARRRYENMSAQISYTFGRGEGHVDRQTDRIAGPDDEPSFDRNKGPVDAQRDHLFAGSLTYDLPYDFQIGGILKLQSGYAFTAFDTFQEDSDGDLRTSDEIAAGQNRGGQRGDSFSQFDIRFSKTFGIGERYRPQVFFEVFNLFNTRNEKFDGVNNTFAAAGLPGPDFGTSTAVAGQFRQAQISVRFEF